MNKERFVRARQFMAENDITYRSMGEQLGVTLQWAMLLLAKNTIPTERHAQLIALGFPPDVLPEPMDFTLGRKPKISRFPGLAGTQSTSEPSLEREPEKEE